MVELFGKISSVLVTNDFPEKSVDKSLCMPLIIYSPCLCIMYGERDWGIGF